MQEAPESPPHATFAGLFSSLTGPTDRSPATRADERAQDDEIAVLSYEQALRAQSRRRPVSEAQGLSAAPLPDPSPAPPAQSDFFADPAFLEAGPAEESPSQQKLKTASITIRMSQAEGQQLRQRAAEAGLTVSAYLRSCAFEVENLRALVKETMLQLKLATAQAAAATERPKPPQRHSWIEKISAWPSHKGADRRSASA